MIRVLPVYFVVTALVSVAHYVTHLVDVASRSARVARVVRDIISKEVVAMVKADAVNVV